MGRVKVWDITVRLFHWALVVAFGFSVFSAFQDKIMTGYDDMHRISGITILILVLFRIFWGFIGSDTARFSQFLRGPKATLAHIRGKGAETYGHNPIGGWSVMLMLLLLLVQSCMGLFATDAMFFEGPLSPKAGDYAGLITAIHRIVGYSLIGLVGLHIAAIIFYTLVKKINLVRPMITGWKSVNPDQVLAAAPKSRSSLWAILLFIATGGLVCLSIF